MYKQNVFNALCFERKDVEETDMGDSFFTEKKDSNNWQRCKEQEETIFLPFSLLSGFDKREKKEITWRSGKSLQGNASPNLTV